MRFALRCALLTAIAAAAYVGGSYGEWTRASAQSVDFRGIIGSGIVTVPDIAVTPPSSVTVPAATAVPTATLAPTGAPTATGPDTPLAIPTASPTPATLPPAADPTTLPRLADAPDEPGATRAVIIDSAGGAVASADGRVSVIVPASIFKEPLDIKISKLDEHAQRMPPSTLTFVGTWQFDALAIDRADAAVHTFPGAVTIVLHFTPEDLSGLMPQSLTLWTFDESAEQWVRVPSRLDLPNLVLTAQVDHFTDFAATSTNIVNSATMLDSRNVDLHSGSASFAVPIQVPAGVGGMTPDLSLSYDSGRVGDMHNFDQGTSWAGIGWDIDVPHIQVSYLPNSSPRVFLSLGDAGSEIMPTGDDDNYGFIWRARNEQYLRIRTSCTTFNCPWTVTDRTGTQYFFGSDVSPSATDPSYGRWYFDQTSPYTRRYYRFDLSYQTDALYVPGVSGNRIDYAYWHQTIGDPARWNQNPRPQYVAAGYLSQITYNGGAASITFNGGDFTNIYAGHQVYDICNSGDAYQPNYGCRRSDTPWSPIMNCPYIAPLVAETRRLTDIEVNVDSQLVRKYVLAYNTDTINNNFSLGGAPTYCLPVENEGTNRLNSVSTYGKDAANPSATPLQTLSFEYTLLQTQYHQPTDSSYYTWPYLTIASNGFGGSDNFTYTHLGNGVNGAFSRRVVTQERHIAGMGQPDMVVTYSYQNGPNQWNYANPYTQTLDTFNSEYRGFGIVTESSLDAQSNVIAQGVHSYFTTGSWDDEVRTGREYDVTVNAAGVTQQHNSTTWSVLPVSNPRTGGGNFVNFIYPAQENSSSGTGTSTAYAQTVNTFDVVIGSGTGGNLVKAEEYTGPPNPTLGTKQLTTTTDFNRNLDTWVFVPQTTTKLDNSTVLAFTRYYYDGANTSAPASPPASGLLTAQAVQLCGPAPAAYACPGSPSGSNWSVTYSVYDTHRRQVQSSVPTATTPESQAWGNSLGWIPVTNPPTPSAQSHYDSAIHPLPDWTSNALGQQTLYEYDWGLQKPTRVTAPNQNVLNYQFDLFGRLTAYWDSIDAAGCPGPSCLPTKTFSYSWGVPNTLNQTISQERVNAATSDVRTIVSCVDGLGREVDHLESYRFTTVQSEVRTDYDERGLKYMETQPAQANRSAACAYLTSMNYFNKTAYSYDALGNVVTTNFLPLGSAFPPTCAEPGGTPVCRKTEVDGLTTTTIDEDRHKVVETRNPSTRQTAVVQYNGDGAGTAWTPYATTTYQYDALGRLKEVWDPLNNHTSMNYDLAGRKTSMNDPDMGYWTYPSYDAAGNLLQQTDAIGTTTTMTYDALNRLKTKSFSNGDLPITYSYDIYLPDQGSTSWCGEGASTAVGMRTKMADGAGEEFTCFNVRGRAVNGVRYVDGARYTTAAGYNDLGTPKSLTYPDGEVVDYQFGADGVGDVTGATSTIDPPGQTIYWNAWRTPWGAPYQLTLGNNLNAGYSYDTRSRIYGYGTGLGGFGSQQLVMLNYDNASNVTDTWEFWGNGEHLQYTYDELNRLKTASGFLGGPPASYNYNEIGNITAKHEGSSDLTTISYPASGPGSVRPHAVIGTTGTPSLSLGYDTNGNLASQGTNTYTYDAENRLVSRPQSSGSTRYTYDGNGTLLMRSDIGDSQQTATLRPNGQGTYNSWTGYPNNDPQHHFENVDEPNPPDDDASYVGAATAGLYDTHRYPSANVPAGSIIDKVTLKFHWKSTGVTLGGLYPAYSQNGAVTNGSFRTVPTSSGYVDNSWELTTNPITQRPWTTSEVNDGLDFGFRTYGSTWGSRVSQASIEVTYRPATSSTTYIGGIYEKNGDGTVVKYYKGMDRTVMIRKVPVGGGAGTRYWPLYDHLGSTVGMLNSAGAIVSSQRYWPYGEARSAQLSPPQPLVTETNKLYTGQQIENGDSALGLYNYKARFYSTTIGRFVSADPIAKDGLNRYSYVLNSPISATDPSGLYLFALCGWTEHCNQGDVEEWRNVLIQYWKSTGRFAGANLDDVFDLFAGARMVGFTDAQLVSIFDVTIRDTANGRWRLDADNSARELQYTIAALYYQTGQSVTYLAGFSWGGVTVNEYLYGVSSGSPGFSRLGLDLKGVYFVGAPNVHSLNNAYNIALTGGECGAHCDEDTLATTLGGPENFNVAKAFSVRVIARSSPADKDVGPLTVHLANLAGEIKGGGEYRRNDGRCTHCVDPQSSWWDAHDLFGLTD